MVDDDLYYLHILEQHLLNTGCTQITKFENGVECLEYLHEQPDVIFLDYQMDIFSGNEVLKKIKRYNPNIYVVMVSAQESIKPVVDALKLGAFDYIQKGDDEAQKVKQVLQKIVDVKSILNRSGAGFFKKLFKFV